jgi:hypothetical protein
MKRKLGFTGFALLIISAVFLDAPIIALLAMPMFLVGFVLVLIFYLDLIKKQKSKSFFLIFMIVLGVILLCGVLGYSVVEYNQYQVDLDRNTADVKLPINWIKILIIAAINIIASVLIYFGIKNSDKLERSELLYVWMISLVLVPFTLLLIKLAVITGFWFGG